MSGPSDMATVVDDAINSAEGLITNVGTLTTNAIVALEKSIILTDGTALSYDIYSPDYKVEYTKKDYVEGLPVIPATLPDAVPTPTPAPALPALELSEAPTIVPILNAFNPPSPPGAFNKPVPLIDDQVDDLGSLDLTVGFSLTRIPLAATIGDLNLVVPPIETITPDTAFTYPDHQGELENIKNLIYNGYDGIPGFNELETNVSQLAQSVLDNVLPLLASELNQRFASAYSTVNDKKESLLDVLYQHSLTDLKIAQHQRAGAITNYKGWKLPGLVQAAIQYTLNEHIDPYIAQNLSKRRIHIIENANKMLEFCLDLYSKFRFNIESIKQKEIEMVLTAHQNAQSYAKNSIEVLFNIFELEEYKLYDVLYKLKEIELKIFDQQLQADMLQYDVVKAQLEIEKAKQDQDGQAVRLFEADLAARDSAIKALAGEMQIISQKYELKKIPLEIMKAKIAAFGAKIMVEEAKLKKRLAVIEQKEYQVKEETTKVALFEDQINAFEKIINTKEQFLNMQIKTNEARIAAFEATVKGNMIPVKASALREQHKLYGHEAGASEYKAEAQRAINEAKMTADFERRKKDMQDEVATVLNDIALELQKIELDRRKSVAEVNSRGASIYASMAEGAMSAANLVVGGALEEFA